MTCCYEPVLTKADFIRRFMAGEFGNRGPNWQTLKEYQTSGYKGLVHIRNRKAGGVTFYNVAPEQVEEQWRSVPAGNFYLAGMAPHDRNLIQGEVAIVPGSGWHLRYSTVKNLPMRDAFSLEPQMATGIIGVSILQHYLCPTSFDWLQVLLKRYAGHVIEFSTFDCNWGTIPHMNTVFWEVRLY
mgnify:CR=1 FL=1